MLIRKALLLRKISLFVDRSFLAFYARTYNFRLYH